MKIKELPKETRPREKALIYGIESLSDQELLAIIIGSGVKNKSALEIGASLLESYSSLFYLSKAKSASLKQQFGLSKISALKLEATFELHNRLITSRYREHLPVESSEDVYQKYRYLENSDHELLVILMLDSGNHILKERIIYQGTNSFLELNLREIIIELAQNNTRRFYLIHNHPNGESFPSQEDIIATTNIANQTKKIGMKLMDHLIIYKNGYYSFKNS